MWGRPAVADLRGVGTLILAAQGARGLAAFDWGKRKELWRSLADRQVMASPLVADLDADGNFEIVVADGSGTLQAISGLGTKGARRNWENRRPK